MQDKSYLAHKINLDYNFNFGLKQANQERQRKKRHTINNKHILLLRRLKSLSKGQKQANSKGKEKEK